MDMLRVRGSRITDAAGREVRLRGFCVGGWLNMENFINGYPGQESSFRSAVARVLGPGKAGFFFDRMLDNFFDGDDVAFMASLGANALRIPMNYRHFEDDMKPFSYRPAALARLDSIVALCGKHGIHVILDLHAAQGWQNPDWHSDNPTHVATLWTQKLFQDRVAGLWRHLASHYRNEPAIAGYNLLNEPVCPVPGALPAVYRHLVSEVRKVDRNHLFFLEGNWFSTDFSEIRPDLDANTVFSSHNYATASFTDGPYPGVSGGGHYDRKRLQKEFLWSNRFMKKNNKPGWVGEFGSIYRGNRRDADRLRVVDDQIGIFEESGTSWTIWTYKDLGVMGTACVRPDSEWMRRTTRVRALKEKLGADTWGQGSSVASRTEKCLLDNTRRAAGKAVDMGKLAWNAKRLIGGLALSDALAAPCAEQFRGMSEKAIARMMESFAFRNCVIRNGLANIISRYPARI